MRNKHSLAAFFILIIFSAAGPLALPASPQDLTAGAKLKVKVVADLANLRERPDISSAIIQQIPEGTVLVADRKDGEWYLVRFTLEDGGVIGGFIHESLVIVLDQAPAQPEKISKPQIKGSDIRAPVKEKKITAVSLADKDFELSLLAGGFFANPDDLNKGASGLADFYSANVGIPYSGTVNSLRLAGGLGVELSYRLSSEFYIGLGIESFLARNKSAIVFNLTPSPGTLFIRPDFLILPIRISARFYPTSNYYIRGNIGYYRISTKYLYRFEAGNSWLQHEGRASSGELGAEAALGSEFKLGRYSCFFIEAGFRLLSADKLKGHETFSNSAGDSVKEVGQLYFFRKLGLDGLPHDLVFIQQNKPGGSDIVSARRVSLNLSTVIFGAGLRFRF